MSTRATVHRHHVNSNGIITIVIKIVLLLVKGEVVAVTITTIIEQLLMAYEFGKDRREVYNE